MHDVYVICAIVGGTVFVIQLVLQMVGFDHDADADADAGDAGGDGGDSDSTSFFGWLSLRSIIASLLFFGLAGLAAEEAVLPPFTSLMIAIGAGLASIFVVTWMMRMLNKLQSDGGLKIATAVGKVGNVYLKVPANSEGHGKVSLTLQGRLVEVDATTPGAELPNGTQVVVTRVAGPELVEVVAHTQES